MGKADKAIYLGKGGKSHGPFSDEEIEQLRLSGEIEKYAYRWDGNAWLALEAPPPPLGARSVSQIDSPSLKHLEAVCHNFIEVVSGLLENVSEAGCDLVSPDPSDSPRLGMKSSLVLSVVDPSHRQAVNVKASVSSVSRKEGQWIYHLRWAHPPAF